MADTGALFQVAEQLTRDVWAVRVFQVVWCILCYLLNGMMSIKSKVSVAKIKKREEHLFLMSKRGFTAGSGTEKHITFQLAQNIQIEEELSHILKLCCRLTSVGH